MTTKPDFVFEINGWNASNPTQLQTRSQAELAFARSIIADEVAGLDKRLHRLEQRLLFASDAREKVEATKPRPGFDLTVKQVEKSGSSTSLLANASYFRNAVKLASIPISQPFNVWLHNQFSSPGQAVLIGKDEELIGPLLQSAGFEILSLSAGEGKTRPVRAGFRCRHRSAADSLAAWLQSPANSPPAAAQIFALGRETTETDLRLLQWHLLPHQALMIDPASAAADTIGHVWDGNLYDFGGLQICTNPGPRFLAPLAGGGDHLPASAWPRVSVVTVSYNQVAYLEDCLRSVLEQDYPNFEYIVIDAVSDDGSLDLLRRYQPQLHALIVERDDGQSHGLNKGFQIASGDLLTWVNSDDMLAPGALKIAALTFLQYGCDLVCGGCERITAQSTEITALQHAAIPLMQPVELGLAENLAWHGCWEQGDYFFQPEVVFTADVWRRAGGFLKQHLYWAMDWDLWIRMAMTGASIVHIPNLVGRSREHPDQKTTSEELYLYQLKNILLEVDEAIELVAANAGHLPAGLARTWPLTETSAIASPDLPTKRSLLRRIASLRSPFVLRRAIRARLSPHRRQQLHRIRTAWNNRRSIFVKRDALSVDRLSHALTLLKTNEQKYRDAQTRVHRLESENAELKHHLANVESFKANTAVWLERVISRSESEVRHDLQRRHDKAVKSIENKHRAEMVAKLKTKARPR